MPSLSVFAELLFPCLDAVGARSVVEVGAYRGDLTSKLLDWASGREARVVAIDPEPDERLVELAEHRPGLELIRKTSCAALPRISPPDVVIIDGDHNYYTVSEELRLVDEGAGEGGLPLVLFHDVWWPHARRDSYYEPERIPEEHRQPLARDGAVRPGDPGVGEVGIQFEWVAEREGGPRNGVLTAIEDFVSTRRGLRLAVVPAFNGFGALWTPDADWAHELSQLLDPWDRNPILERLEEERIEYLIRRRRLRRSYLGMEAAKLRRERALESARKHAAELEALLLEMLGSRAFALADRFAHARCRDEKSWRQRARSALRGPTKKGAG